MKIELTADQHNFHLKEAESIRAEVAVLLARTENLLKYSVIAGASVYAWLLSNALGLDDLGGTCLRMPIEVQAYAWYIPAAFSFSALFIAFINQMRVNKMGAYLKKVEIALGHKELGWEKFSQPGFPVLTVSVGLLWLALAWAATSAGDTGLQLATNASDVQASCAPAPPSKR